MLYLSTPHIISLLFDHGMLIKISLTSTIMFKLTQKNQDIDEIFMEWPQTTIMYSVDLLRHPRKEPNQLVPSFLCMDLGVSNTETQALH